ncbi:MAG: TetR/AcrR family transcriptional regulator [Acidimicrobiia bacterium]|nr:TetR/AcrR family transcriptional regulator [Acidimicrobiia bacterium]
MAVSGEYGSASGETPRRRSGTHETTERLLRAAASEFVEHGFDAARVSAIARRAGLTSGAVYARWPNKSDVMVAALEYIFQQSLLASRIKKSGVDGMKPPDVIETLGANLLEPDESRDVLVQVFGSARNNEKIKECLLTYLNQDAQQITEVVEESKQAGLVDPELSTAAMSLMCRATALGAHLLVSAGLDDRYVPTQDEWNRLISTLIGATAPRSG